jgi:predicted transcriptional regulator
MKSTAKQEAQRVLDALPEDTPLERIQYHLYVVQKIEAGLDDVREGRVLDQDEVERRMAKWLEP